MDFGVFISLSMGLLNIILRIFINIELINKSIYVVLIVVFIFFKFFEL